MQVEHNGFPSNILPSIKTIAKKEGYTTYDVTKKRIPTDGASYLGEHFLVTIRGRTEEGEKENNIFVKCRIPDSKIGEILDLPQAYAAEAYVYNELFQIFTELQDEAAIPEEDKFRTIKSYDESNFDALFLENIALKGYKSCHRTYLPTLEITELAIKELAKFHALAFTVQQKSLKTFETIKAVRTPFIFNEEWHLKGEDFAKITVKHLKGESKERLEKFIPKYSIRRKYHLQDTTKRSCLCHGDFKLTNLMMKYIDGELSDLITVDFQLVHYGCPINDFLLFIFMGTDKQFRKQHLNYLKDLYYENFKDFLQKFDLDSKDIYPRQEFEKDYKERLDYGLIAALFFMPYFLGAAEGQDPNAGAESDEIEFKMHESFPERAQGIVDDFVAWGYL